MIRRNKMSRVAVVRCDDYDNNNVSASLERALELLGGMGSFVKAGEKILLKPNLLAPALPEKCVTTHPSVFRSSALLAKAAKAELSYGDSPGFTSMESAAKKCGIAAAAEELSVTAADFTTGVEVHYPEGRQNKRFTVAKGVLDCGGLISICKLKTHGFEKYTGALKNQFGCVPGMLKGEFHVKVPDAENFARMLLDLNAFINPRLYITDAVMAMEGNGPNGGDPVKLGLLLVSDDPIASDRVACHIMNINPDIVPTVRLGGELGYGTADMERITLLGDNPDSFVRKSFKIDRTPLKPLKTKGLMKTAANRLVDKPVIDRKRCIKCGVCVRMCPVQPKAVDWGRNGAKEIPIYNYSRCIRCYCCQELCAETAIKLKKPLARRLLGKIKKAV
jgi:uncharacterized protein (DUF362 family)/Pyruvate/2-oxoacid:ferredoxin oxidoreductase delta subunit